MNNLNFLFQTDTPQILKPLTILDSKVALFKRSNSHKWQCRFKLDSGSWCISSTNHDQKVQATTRAIEIYE